ncbi:MAG: DMT family transporter [Chloroflexota bacterium]
MITLIINIIVGIIGGIAAGLQAPFTGVMGQRVGELGSVLFTYGLGAIVILVIVLGAAATGTADLSQWRTIPWWAFFAGPLGLVIIGSLAYAVPRVGATTATMLFLVGWLIFSAIVDHFGWFGTDPRPLDLQKSLGVLTLLLGGWLVLR